MFLPLQRLFVQADEKLMSRRDFMTSHRGGMASRRDFMASRRDGMELGCSLLDRGGGRGRGRAGPQLTSFPNGERASLARRKCMRPKGMPMMVM